MTRLCWGLALVLTLAAGLLAYQFLLKGEVAPASDGRTAVLLLPGERDLVLGEMRAFLRTVQAIVAGAQAENMESVTAAARQVGAAARQGVPASLIGKLPGEFKMLGFDTHRRFDSLALDAEQLGDPAHSLEQLGALMSNCVACHEAYRIDPARP